MPENGLKVLDDSLFWKKYSDLKISVDNGTGSPQESGGKITFTDLKLISKNENLLCSI